MRLRHHLVGVAALSFVASIAAVPAPGAPAAGDATALDRLARAVAPGRSYDITLVTGDTVHVRVTPDGGYQTRVEMAPRPDGAEVTATTLVGGGHAYTQPRRTDSIPAWKRVSAPTSDMIAWMCRCTVRALQPRARAIVSSVAPAASIPTRSVSSWESDAYSYQGPNTGFEGWSGGTAQDSWTITDEAGSGKAWVFDDPGAKGNLTGGEGQFAIVDNWAFPTAFQDTSLVSPSADLTDQTDPVIGFDTYSYDFGFQIQDGDVDLSLDGGATWTNVWHAPDAFVAGPVTVTLDAASVGQPGDYAGRLAIATDTPYRVAAVPIAMHVQP